MTGGFLMTTLILGVCTALFVLVTLLPLSRKTAWWVRGADFPRLQFAVAGFVLLAAELLTLERDHTATWIMASLTLACLIYQAWWIIPYTPLHPKEVKTAAGSQPADRVRILSVNVLMSNRRADDLLRIVRAEKPDVLVTLETNRWWEEALKAIEVDYPHTLKCPLENRYGMHLYSRFPLEDAKIQYLVEPDVPSMHTLLALPSGRRVRLHCLHPAPPSPTEKPTSKERDAELVMVGRSVVDSKYPVIVSGDLNDVAWSATTRLFRKVSRLLDPRIGRSMCNSFHAQHLFMRWPVDHFFHSSHFTFVRLTRLESCGSDHFPVLIELALDDAATQQQDGLAADAEDQAEAEEKCRTRTSPAPKFTDPEKRLSASIQTRADRASGELRVKRDLRGLEQPRDRATCLRACGDLRKLLRRDIRHLGRRIEMDTCDRPARLRMILQRYDRAGRNRLGGESRLLQLGRKRHAETAGVRRADQLLGIGARPLFEPGTEGILRVLQDRAFSGNCAATGFEVAAPDGGSFAIHRSDNDSD
jgi:endonuclease/exonuclease/phosphatase (EEP) superfamily protein YafD